VFDHSNRTDGTFSRANFAFDPQRDRYTCPAGKELVQFRRNFSAPRTGITSAGTRPYRASQKDCGVCEQKARCCPNTPARKIPRTLHEDARDAARALALTPEYEAACKRCKKVEMLFAHPKRILRLGRLRLRSLCGAKDEFLLAATAQNLTRLARLRRLPSARPESTLAHPLTSSTISANSRPSAGIDCCQWHHSGINLILSGSRRTYETHVDDHWRS
jgi:Transposase DDE domain